MCTAPLSCLVQDNKTCPCPISIRSGPIWPCLVPTLYYIVYVLLYAPEALHWLLQPSYLYNTLHASHSTFSQNHSECSPFQWLLCMGTYRVGYFKKMIFPAQYRKPQAISVYNGETQRKKIITNSIKNQTFGNFQK